MERQGWQLQAGVVCGVYVHEGPRVVAERYGERPVFLRRISRRSVRRLCRHAHKFMCSTHRKLWDAHKFMC